MESKTEIKVIHRLVGGPCHGQAVQIRPGSPTDLTVTNDGGDHVHHYLMRSLDVRPNPWYKRTLKAYVWAGEGSFRTAMEQALFDELQGAEESPEPAEYGEARALIRYHAKSFHREGTPGWHRLMSLASRLGKPSDHETKPPTFERSIADQVSEVLGYATGHAVYLLLTEGPTIWSGPRHFSERPRCVPVPDAAPRTAEDQA